MKLVKYVAGNYVVTAAAKPKTNNTSHAFIMTTKNVNFFIISTTYGKCARTHTHTLFLPCMNVRNLEFTRNFLQCKPMLIKCTFIIWFLWRKWNYPISICGSYEHSQRLKSTFSVPNHSYQFCSANSTQKSHYLIKRNPYTKSM